jgi:hypothetical protein
MLTNLFIFLVHATDIGPRKTEAKVKLGATDRNNPRKGIERTLGASNLVRPQTPIFFRGGGSKNPRQNCREFWGSKGRSVRARRNLSEF